MVLGDEDYGLYGLLGSLTLFVTFLNIQFSQALSRFYAYSFGRVKVVGESEALLESKKWFTCGVFIHTVVPCILLAIGYPIGAYAIEEGWLTIPAHRVMTCLWIWRFACINAAVAMFNTPFNAMYTAKQYIAELTVYSVAQTIIRTAFIYCMTIIPGDWLFGYALGMCLIIIVPQAIICLRAIMVFPECKFVASALKERSRFQQIAAYAWWQTIGGAGYLARHQLLEIIVNRHFGPKANAAYTVGAQFSAEATSLSGALLAAFSPAISTAYGAGDCSLMRLMAYRACKFCALLTLVFAIPMFIEVDEVLRLWLKNPPEGASALCMIMIGVVVIEKITAGHVLAVNATGKIAAFQIASGAISVVAVPIALFLLMLTHSVNMVAMALLITTALTGLAYVVIARPVAGLSARLWVRDIFVPITFVTLVAGIAGYVPQMLLPSSLFRVSMTTVSTLVVFVPASIAFVMDAGERKFLFDRIHRCVERFSA